MSAEEEQRGLLSPTGSRLETLETEITGAAEGGSDGHRAAGRALQVSHFLSTFGARGWEFSVGLLMLELHPASLLLVALWGLLDAALSVLCGAAVGTYVDRQPRLVAASRMYLLQNSMVAASASTALALLLSSLRSGPLYAVGLVATMTAGSVSTLGALGSSLSVEREWTKALCGSDSAALARLNAAMKRIDLTCLIVSPILVGLVMQHAGGQPMVSAMVVLLAWNLVGWAPEARAALACMVLLLRYAQRCSPALAADRSAGGSSSRQDAATSADKAVVGNSNGSGRRNSGWRPAEAVQQQAQAWALYARQPAAAAALALALLYFTVMSWGTLMTAYLKSLGLPEAELAVYRGLGALSGILATVLFPPLHRWLGLVATGALSIWAQLACLLAAVLPAVAAALGAAVGTRARTYCLVWGLVLSRFGLWSFDLASNQLIQETVAHDSLGAISGAQGSLQSLFQMLAYLAGVVVPATQDFVWLMAGSCCIVLLAAALFTGFALRTRCGRGLDVAPELATPPL